jgi:hypothetical protein
VSLCAHLEDPSANRLRLSPAFESRPFPSFGPGLNLSSHKSAARMASKGLRVVSEGSSMDPWGRSVEHTIGVPTQHRPDAC